MKIGDVLIQFQLVKEFEKLTGISAEEAYKFYVKDNDAVLYDLDSNEVSDFYDFFKLYVFNKNKRNKFNSKDILNRKYEELKLIIEKNGRENINTIFYVYSGKRYNDIEEIKDEDVESFLIYAKSILEIIY